MALSTADVAGIVFAETRSLKADAGDDGVAALSALRKGLAWVVQRTEDGLYFAPPEEPTIADLGDDQVSATWRDCIAAAKAPTVPDGNRRPNVAYFAPVDPVTDANFADTRNKAPWLKTAVGSTAVGRASLDGVVLRLWQMEATTASGRFPRTEKTLEHALAVPTPGFTNPIVGGALFLALLVLLVLPAIQTWSQSRDALGTLCADQTMKLEDGTHPLKTECLKALRAQDAADTSLATAIADSDGTPAKLEAVTKARAEVEARKADVAKSWPAAPVTSPKDAAPTKPDRTPLPLKNVFSKCVLSFFGILGLLSLISYGMRSQLLGFLIDERGRMSLARFQFVAWTIIILAAYWTAAAWNLALTEAVDGSVLPTMSMDLWILLGIVTASPLASALIIGAKKQADAPANTDTTPPHVNPNAVDNEGVVDVRTTPSAASFLDLFIGEEVSNRGNVDISRVQQFIFTLVTLFAFIALTLQLFSHLDEGVRIVQLPPLDASLVGLLAISHAAYLTAKSLPKGAKTFTSGTTTSGAK